MRFFKNFGTTSWSSSFPRKKKSSGSQHMKCILRIGTYFCHFFRKGPFFLLESGMLVWRDVRELDDVQHGFQKRIARRVVSMAHYPPFPPSPLSVIWLFRDRNTRFVLENSNKRSFFTETRSSWRRILCHRNNSPGISLWNTVLDNI